MNKILIKIAILILSTPALAEWHTIQMTPTTQYRYLNGEIEAVNRATVSSQTSGRIKKFYFDIDDYVKKGDVIVEFTNEEQKAVYAKAKANEESVNIALKQSEIDYKRTQEIYQNKLISKSHLDQAKSKRDGLTANYRAATAAVISAKKQLDYTIIKAPYDGIVTKRFVEQGETISPGKPIIEGLNLVDLRVITHIPEAIIAIVKDSPNAKVSINHHHLLIKDITIFPYADRATRTFKTRIEIDADGQALFPGMTVKVAFAIGENLILMIPKSSVIHRSELAIVYVKYNEGQLLRHIKLGKSYGEFVEVLSGLKAGEQILTNTDIHPLVTHSATNTTSSKKN
ncbi:MAG: efflux transporter periplasmic adaptor subunit [Gammaproteobacteria bacterium]|nr:MAG: efflux transporter periplasmic adaptor subunit [Gammaproteobacteria bacterium]